MTKSSSLRGTLLAAALVVTGCDSLPEIPRRLFDRGTPRERYEERLDLAGLGATALVRDWHRAAERALAEAPRVAVPHQEEIHLPPAEPTALAYRVPVRRGQEITVAINLVGDTLAQIFVEAWLQEADTTRPARRVAVADSLDRSLTVEPSRDGELTVRIQPELLRGGRLQVQLRAAPTLAFPVEGRRESDIGSRFGVERDGGARSHHGVDIFAPRGTPALAAAPAVVTRVSTTPRGGRVVWLRDHRGNSLYYAHLDRQAVVEGTRVGAGDTIGFVGNTGNAITTPPHLHFGVYRRGEGPLDPHWFLHRPGSAVERMEADTAVLGARVRVTGRQASVVEAPGPGTPARRTITPGDTIRVIGAVGRWYRVALADGTTGYVVAEEMQTEH